MNVLTLEDLLEVSMFKCKICCRRLQCPVLQVGLFGNICGLCHESSVFTDVIPNVDVETLLAKLQVPCNFKERGCTYDGPYYKTCKHERHCEFRDKICPFACVGICDNTPGDFHEIPTHISSCHEESVLLGKMNCPVQVLNPTEENPDLLYLLNMDDHIFLLRTWIDLNEECISYTFYCLKNDIDLKNIKIAFNLKFNNIVFNVSGINVHVQPESAIWSAYDYNNVVKIPATTLRSLNCLESVEVLILLDEQSIEVLAEVEHPRSQSSRIRCVKCWKVANTNIFTCAKCKTTVCKNCALDVCCIGLHKHSWNIVDFSLWGLVYEIPCPNSGCNEILDSKKLVAHREVCSFRKHLCPLPSEAGCTWQGLIKNLATHMTHAHPNLINQNTCTLKNSKIRFFVKDNNVFKQTFDLSSCGDLSVTTTKLTAPTSNKSYKWEIRVKRQDWPMMIITDLCTEEEEEEKTVNVENYVIDDELILYSAIHSVHECSVLNDTIKGEASEILPT